MYCDTCGSSKVSVEHKWCYACGCEATLTYDPEEYLNWIVINLGEEKYEQLHNK